MSLLKKLYDGDVYPSEEIVCRTPEYRTLYNKINEEREYFKSRFSPEDAERFDEFEGFITDSSSLYAYSNFAYGFKLGAMLMCEIMTGDNKPKPQD